MARIASIALLGLLALVSPLQAQLRSFDCTTFDDEPGELWLFIASTPTSEIAEAFGWEDLCSISDDINVQHALVRIRLRLGAAEAFCSEADNEENLLALYTRWRSLVGDLANLRIRNSESREIAAIWPSQFLDSDMTGRVEWSC